MTTGQPSSTSQTIGVGSPSVWLPGWRINSKIGSLPSSGNVTWNTDWPESATTLPLARDGDRLDVARGGEDDAAVVQVRDPVRAHVDRVERAELAVEADPDREVVDLARRVAVRVGEEAERDVAAGVDPDVEAARVGQALVEHTDVVDRNTLHLGLAGHRRNDAHEEQRGREEERDARRIR